MILQIVRYGFVGVGVTAMQAGVYWTLATLGHLHSQWANFCGYLVAVIAGYILHGRITFRGNGRSRTSSGLLQGARFVAVSLLSLALNALWVWLCVSWQHWPTWTPIPGMMFLTPAIVFVLNRQWVFR